MKSKFLTGLLVVGVCTLSFGQPKQRSAHRVILPSVKLLRCMKSECFQLLQDDPPRLGDFHPEEISVDFLDRWCPFGIEARYNKAVPLETLRTALEQRYGKGTDKDWAGAATVIWQVESEHLLILLDVADKRIAEKRRVEVGTRTIHYTDTSRENCPVR